MPRDEPGVAEVDVLSEDDLLGRIRSGRAEKRRKRPFRPTLYARVSGLVKRYGLSEAFLRSLETPRELPREDELGPIRLKPKEPYEPPLFPLSTEDEHRVTQAILARVNNPYLEHATSPDEILVCGSLFRQNPSLHAETLARHHFETLLLAGSARRQIGRLTERVSAIRDRGHPDAEEQSRLPLLLERLAALRTFVTSIDDCASK